ncbi:DNA repair protein [Pseudoalteromonas haloplanktis]|nr:DNA repair protein [Pseudoalteromonas haloplanktis]
MKKQTLLGTAILSLMLMLSGCQSAYYSAMEKVGVHKRDILIDRVEETKDSQQESQEEFQSALERLTTLINFDGGELQDAYNQLNDDYESNLAAANEVSSNINKVEDVADALFDEWSDELEQYKSASLKRQSSKKLAATQRQFSQLLRSMRSAESKMEPVLSSLQDNVLYLKHNLNAQAVAAIKGEFTNLKRDIQLLMNDMNKSIEDSNKFIEQMNTTG